VPTTAWWPLDVGLGTLASGHVLATRPFGMQVAATRLEYPIRVHRSEDERGRLRCRYPGRMIVSESGVRPRERRGWALTVAGASSGVGAGSVRQSHGRRARILLATWCYEVDRARARFRQRRPEPPCGRWEARRIAGTWEPMVSTAVWTVGFCRDSSLRVTNAAHARPALAQLAL
jgi:hypothetical protein